jgi:hypothetical protein
MILYSLFSRFYERFATKKEIPVNFKYRNTLLFVLLIIISGLPAVFRIFLPPTTFDILAIHPVFGGFDIPIYFYFLPLF